ncbi:hypothetical protein F4777DRAFT_600691 [Nemania sp. FL0916]|nr:hypothetical protein F4777DRAFT_600691 [Nemania sp. FL0916]
MRFICATLVSLAALVAAAPPYNNTTLFACGNPHPTEDHLAMLAKIVDEEQMTTSEASEIPPVNVHFHIIASSKTEAGGWVNDSQITDQVAVMNTNYNPNGITFKLAGTSRTVNAGWAQGQDTEAMKTALRKGKYSDLNIYLQQSLGGNIAGICTLPNSVGGQGSYNTDGCQVVTGSLPSGGPHNGLNDGKCAVHEVGHWFGLLHTFQGGCDAPGDYIDDTPYEKSAPQGGGCPTGLNSCPNQPGNDPIHNHMDYTSGDCKTQFTAGQEKRMHTQWDKFRAGK